MNKRAITIHDFNGAETLSFLPFFLIYLNLIQFQLFVDSIERRKNTSFLSIIYKSLNFFECAETTVLRAHGKSQQLLIPFTIQIITFTNT